MFIKNKKDPYIYNYLINICYNIFISLYDDYFMISNPKLIIKYIPENNLKLLNTISNQENII
jgi:hypothetical protein